MPSLWVRDFSYHMISYGDYVINIGRRIMTYINAKSNAVVTIVFP